MTREEAIKDIQDNILPVVGGKSLQMAIEALKAQNVTDTNVGNNDLISRQDAIDVTWEEPTYTDPINVLTEVRDKIKALPSAQSELHYDEWCTDCKEYDHERHCCPRWNKVIKQTVEDLKGADRKWIPCSERLPEVEERVLVTDDSGGARTVDTDRLGQY